MKAVMRMKLSFTAISMGALLSPLTVYADFLSDSKANLNLKNYYFSNDYRDGAAAPSKQEEWGQAFILDYISGYTPGPVGFGLDAQAMLGVKLDSGGRTDKAGRSRQPGAFFPLDDDNSPVDNFGSSSVTAKARISKTELKYGMLQPQLPVVLSNSGRLLPQNYTGGQIVSKDIDRFTFVGGQLIEAKGRTASGHTDLSVSGANSARSASGSSTAAPARFSDNFLYAGVDYSLSKSLSLQYYYGQLEDFYQQHYLGLKHVWVTDNDHALTTDLRYYNSRSDGKNGTATGRAAGYTMKGYYGNNTGTTGDTRGEVDNQMFTARLSYAIGAHSFGVGYQQLRGDSDFPWLDQGNGNGKYTFTSVLTTSFTSAEERTRMVDYNYDFAGLGLPGLRLSLMYLYGDRIASFTGSKKEIERNSTIGYVVQSGPLKNVSVTWLNATYHTDMPSSRNADHNRLIIAYNLPLF